ncbi:MAG: PAS domain S-box protein, partial [Bacillota bacterium]
MNVELFVGLINNAALLMALIIVYELTYVISIRNKRVIPILNGVLISLIGLAIMMVPFPLKDGIVFDTRSILISVTALTFGPIPSIIAAVILAIYRIILGGAGAIMGVAVLTSSTLIGILWRKFLLTKNIKYRWLNIYLFGIVVHLAMLSCTIFLPASSSAQVLREISLPVMLIYPIGTVILSILLLQQQERKEAVLQIAEAEGKYRSIFNNNNASMLLIDPENEFIVDANPAAVAFYGWSVEQLKSMKITQINAQSEEEVKNNLRKSVNRRQNHFFFQHRTANGKMVDVEVYSGPIVINGKQLLYSIIHDTSERAAAIRALQESEERFRLLIESAPEAIYMQLGGRFAFLNKYAVSLFGASSESELLETPVMDRFHPDFHQIIKDRMQQLHTEQKSVPAYEEIYLKMDGTPVNVDVTAVYLHYNDMDGTLVFARDITDRKKLEHAKNEMEAQLRQQQKLEAIGTLAGGVAHEINNPINGIMNYAQLILDLEQKNEEIKTYAGEIIHETERVATIVKNLLQFSRQEKQSHSYASIYDIVNQTISLIKTVVKRDQIELDVD